MPPELENCTVSPIPATAKGRLLLGNYRVATTVPWVIPAGVEVIGLGIASGSTDNTTIQAHPSFSSQNGALIELGGGSGGSDAKLRGVTIDCAAVSSCTVGVLNTAGNDNARVQERRN